MILLLNAVSLNAAKKRSLEETTFFEHIPKEDLDIFVMVIRISRMKQCNSYGVILKWH